MIESQKSNRNFDVPFSSTTGPSVSLRRPATLPSAKKQPLPSPPSPSKIPVRTPPKKKSPTPSRALSPWPLPDYTVAHGMQQLIFEIGRLPNSVPLGNKSGPDSNHYKTLGYHACLQTGKEGIDAQNQKYPLNTDEEIRLVAEGLANNYSRQLEAFVQDCALSYDRQCEIARTYVTRGKFGMDGLYALLKRLQDEDLLDDGLDDLVNSFVRFVRIRYAMIYVVHFSNGL